ncbi:MAG: hypothetical protein R2873_35280 [Caldilineaceae bacterium]
MLAWFNPTNPATPDATYYWLQATVQLVGRLYGAVDFEVIKVEVEVLVYAGIRLTIEAYQPIVIELVAGVKVRASVKVLFVKVHFSFSLTVRESFTIGHAEPTPWHIAAGTRALARGLDLFARTLPAPPTPLFWRPIAVWGSVQPLPVLFQPAFSKGMIVDQPGALPPADDADPTEAKGIALLFVPNGIPAQADAPEDLSAAAAPAPFDQLGQSLLAWALHAYLADPNNPPPLQPVGSASTESPFSPSIQRTSVRRDDLSALYDALIQRNDSRQLPFSLQSVLDFLAANFKIGIDLAPANVDTSAAIFPMPPALRLDVTGQDRVDFAAHRLLDSATLRSLYAYFDDLRTQAADEPTARTRDLAPPMSLATFLFVDYFAMITRMAVQSAIEHMDDNDLTVMSLPDLLTAMQQRGRFNHIAGMFYRFLLNGLSLPAAVDGEETYPLYALSGQQFAVPAALPADFSIALSVDSVPGWLRFGPEPPPPAEDETPPPPVTHIAYVPAAADRAFVAALAGITVAPAILRQDATPRYQPAPQRFALEHAVDWRRAAGDRRIWQLPAKLQDQLAAESSFPVTLLAGRRQPSGPTGLVTAPVTNASWATRIKFQLRRIPGADGEPLADTYLVLGADAVGVDLLEALWRQMTAPAPAAAELFLLHTADGGLAERRRCRRPLAQDQPLHHHAQPRRPAGAQPHRGRTALRRNPRRQRRLRAPALGSVHRGQRRLLPALPHRRRQRAARRHLRRRRQRRTAPARASQRRHEQRVQCLQCRGHRARARGRSRLRLRRHHLLRRTHGSACLHAQFAAAAGGLRRRAHAARGYIFGWGHARRTLGQPLPDAQLPRSRR